MKFKALSAYVPLQEVRCDLLDLVLGLTYAPADLDELLLGLGWGHPGCQCHPGRGPIAHGHGLAHNGQAAARRLQTSLDVTHSASMLDLERRGAAAVTEALARDLWTHPRLAGLAWAVARSTRSDVEAIRPQFAKALALDAIRVLAREVRRGAPAEPRR